ncbi:hypothetical protein KM043_003801 [Ampulex compressa]|nr:hypothetical protein KM043_003801 [Ampulex compressa]
MRTTSAVDAARLPANKHQDQKLTGAASPALSSAAGMSGSGPPPPTTPASPSNIVFGSASAPDVGGPLLAHRGPSGTPPTLSIAIRGALGSLSGEAAPRSRGRGAPG